MLTKKGGLLTPNNSDKFSYEMAPFFVHSDLFFMRSQRIPATYDQWWLHRNKLGIMNSVFNEAYAEVESTGIPLSEAMKKREELLNLKGNEWNDHSKRLFKKLHQMPVKGKRTLGSDCHSNMIPFLAN